MQAMTKCPDDSYPKPCMPKQPASTGSWPIKTPTTKGGEPVRRYPSFRDAVTEPPKWIGDDAPFDVAKYFDAPAWGENAEPLYLDALSEFGDMSDYAIP